MSRLAMSCYAATKHQYPDSDKKVARVQSKEKKQGKGRSSNKYGEMEATISLDKYNGKLMNSIWGLYNRYASHHYFMELVITFEYICRNSPHNFKSLQNAEEVIAIEKEQGMKADSKKVGSSSFVQFSVPQFSGMVALETKFEVTKQKTSLEKLENLFASPIF